MWFAELDEWVIQYPDGKIKIPDESQGNREGLHFIEHMKICDAAASNMSARIARLKKQAAKEAAAKNPAKLIEQAVAAAVSSVVNLRDRTPYKPAPELSKWGRWKLLHHTALATRPQPKWLVVGMLPQTGLAVIYGKPKSGKSFLALSLACSIATGQPWFGRPVKPGAVVYLSGEGADGLMQRRAVAIAEYGLTDDAPLYFIEGALPLGSEGEVKAAIEELRAEIKGPIAAVVVDTLARSMSASALDENSATDMGKAVKGCDTLREQLHCLVVTVHHEGKDGSRGMRDSIALEGALDTAIRNVRDQTTTRDIVRVKIERQKDGPDGEELLFDMVVVDAGADGEGQPVTSMVLRARAAGSEGDPDTGKQGNRDALRPGDQDWLRVFERHEGNDRTISREEWKTIGRAEGCSENDVSFRTAVSRLITNGRIEVASRGATSGEDRWRRLEAGLGSLIKPE